MFGSNSGSSVFGQQPAFGGFGGSTPSSPFGSTLNQSQPSFGFGASSQPSFGAPSFGSASTPSFGATSTPAFGSTTTSTFGTSAFGSGGAFATSTTPAFGSSSTSAFGASNAPSFGATSTPAFGAGSTPAFGASSSPSFNFGTAQASSPFGSTPSFGAQSSAFGSQTSAPAFSSGFGQSASGTTQQVGSRIAPYTATPEADSGTQNPGKLETISAMPVYKDKSHEEIRWEDYQRGDKGGPNPAAQATPGMGFGASSVQSSPFASSSAFGQSSSNPFSSPASSTPFSTTTSVEIIYPTLKVGRIKA